MKCSTSMLATTATLISTIFAHGMITSPTPRKAGTAMEAACGTQVYNNQASDSYGNIQGELQVAATQTDYDAAACNIWLCKGYKFADSAASAVQSWTAGQVVPFTFDVRAPHTGYANVSIVNTATNTIIGSELLYYADFADNAKTIPANETSFSITIPSDLGDTCSTAGACVVQHFWNAESIDQTYESCVDFTVGGSGDASGSSSSSVVVSSEVATSTSVAVVASSSSILATSTSVAAVAASSPVSTSKATSVATTFSSVPTTLQTVAVPSVSATSTTSSESSVATPDAGDDEDDCE